jgi:hypothetical protein
MLLLAAGADVAARDGTACLVAAQWRTELVDVMLAAGVDLDAADDNGHTPRSRLAENLASVDVARVEFARRSIAKMRLDFVRHRAWQVCVDLQSRGLDALQMCEIQLYCCRACGPVVHAIAFHQWWKIAT